MAFEIELPIPEAAPLTAKKITSFHEEVSYNLPALMSFYQHLLQSREINTRDQTACLQLRQFQSQDLYFLRL